MEAASLINKVTPQYPPIAKTAHVSGTVILHAIISKDGSIQELAVRLRPSAVDEGRDGCREGVALQAHHAQWRAGGSGYDD